MTDVITFSRPYAEAAYKVAVNDNTIDIWLQDMNILGKAIKDSRVKALLASPKIKKLDKIEFLTSLTNNKNELLESFLSVLIDNKKIYYMDSIFDLYQEMVLNNNNITIGTIDTAFALTDQQKKSLQNYLEKKHNKKIQIDEKIDKSLLAGIKISVDNKVTDHSVRYRLNLMREQILK
ncbi:MAG: F0F1 ATP synthase subunit delta [Pseudomonadota bacterium]|nr:F0F1 ATP synthase subunit delta [Pseudomonadota bacterium]